MKKERNLLVVVDMVNGFINEGNLADKSINRITNNVVSLVEDAIQNNINIVAFKDTHTENDVEFNSFPPHCIKGTNECELIPELKIYEKFMYVIEKPTTNGFETDKFKNLMECVKFDNIYVCGCCTDICVYNFVNSLNDFLQRNYLDTNIVVVQDAVDTFNGTNHKADEVNYEYLSKMNNLGVSITEYSNKIFQDKNEDYDNEKYLEESEMNY